ncbi:ABC-2 type transport system ATP-binding protein/lipopolysaccharide transport system ATP-binding protein [Geodermatophilus tzadiensis]|uniref:ABC-2 type transport system ATP-binding protein/lipopolysaccharide transport system ATP-binding protein n=1 Tax=Geodermatophilus tzadiensis TaxID=1137988 RepID=A0A2T0TR76_9ACTN|nr:ABC transporter ATP-binding protein [Geodermatophilus tzadiensis]PRY48133.1 ABC-2 type transport system ATP-binding protein/lipopolysaccharide transport system ATP-binding protein [Geodermatophilus tzadiensis]
MDRIQFEDVSKRYVLGDRANAREALVAAAKRAVRPRRAPAPKEVWSLRDVSFAVADGETLGILGRNGAGKSTVLKVLAGITSPTAGVSRTRGRVAALLEVGTGFHQELTGRENVYLNGAILGMSRRDIGRAFDAIVDFSGVERFLDTPVKRYSSGMYLRLAFAVAAHLDPDVLVVDEVLAVGDAEFQRKCLGRMEEAGSEGRTIVFVSHDLDALTSLCRRSLWLDAGQVRASGDTRELVRDYLASGGVAQRDSGPLASGGPITLHGVGVYSAVSRAQAALVRDEPVRIEVDFSAEEDVAGLDLAVFVTTASGVRVLDQALSDGGPPRISAGRWCVTLEVPPILNVGEFTVGVWFGTAHTDLLDEPVTASFTLFGSDRGRPGRILVQDLPMSLSRADGSR